MIYETLGMVNGVMAVGESLCLCHFASKTQMCLFLYKAQILFYDSFLSGILRVYSNVISRFVTNIFLSFSQEFSVVP